MGGSCCGIWKAGRKESLASCSGRRDFLPSTLTAAPSLSAWSLVELLPKLHQAQEEQPDRGLCLLLFCLPSFLLHVVTTATARHGDRERKAPPQAACILWERKNRPGSNSVLTFPPRPSSLLPRHITSSNLRQRAPWRRRYLSGLFRRPRYQQASRRGRQRSTGRDAGRGSEGGLGDLLRLLLGPGKEGPLKGFEQEKDIRFTFLKDQLGGLGTSYLKVVTLESKGDKNRCQSRMVKPWIWSDMYRETAPEKSLQKDL